MNVVKKVYSGKYIVIEGPDLGGKGTFIKGIEQFFLEESTNDKNDKHGQLFNIKKFWTHSLKHSNDGFHPSLSELCSNFVLVTEPTYIGIGKDIREHKIKNGTTSTSFDIAQNYADDRMILLRQVVIPALENCINVISDRNIISSLFYQPLYAKFQGEELTENDILSFSGNKLAYNLHPDIVFVIHANIDELVSRIKLREDKKDDSIFEKEKFLKELIPKYLDLKANSFGYVNNNTEIYLIDSSNYSIEHTQNKGYEFIKEFI